MPLRLDFDDTEPRVFVVAPEEAGERLDRYLSARIGEFSRALVQRLIDGGSVKVDGAAVRGSIVEQGRAKKIVIYTYKKRQNSNRKQAGHRQAFTAVKIESIDA